MDPILLANNTQHCWAQQCCDLLRPFAWNHNNVGTCVQFETGQTFAVWPNKSQNFYCSVHDQRSVVQQCCVCFPGTETMLAS